MILSTAFAASSEDCDFYLNFTSHPNCSEKYNYLKKYGHKYCMSFLKNRRENNRWSPELKDWAMNTSVCLQEMIELNNKRLWPSCEQLTEFAFDTHSICYKQYGVCRLKRADQIRIVKMVSLVDLFSNFRNSMTQMMNVGLSCLGYEATISDLARAFFYRVINSKSAWKKEEYDYVEELIDLIPEEESAAKEYFEMLAPHFLFDDATAGSAEALKFYSSEYEVEKTEGEVVLKNREVNTPPFSKEAYVYKTLKSAPKEIPTVLKKANEAYTEKLTRKQLLGTLEAARSFNAKRRPRDGK